MAVKKLYYSMGEVAEMFDVNRSLIRHWESKFDCLRPHKNKKGNRMFTPADIERLKQIYHLVKEQGMTLEGANKVMKSSTKEISRDTTLLERLQRIRSVLVEVRDSLGDENALASDTSAWEEVAEEPAAEPRAPRKVVKIESEQEQEQAQEAQQTKPRRVVRRKKSDDENKELFPFYEQSLF